MLVHSPKMRRLLRVDLQLCVGDAIEEALGEQATEPPGSSWFGLSPGRDCDGRRPVR